jgi:LPXTG-site transpeptidase (sortase) family protein
MTRNNRYERVLRCAEWLLVTIGAVLIALATTRYVAANRVQAQLQATLQAARATDPPPLEGTARRARFPWNVAIARLGVSVAVLEGTNEHTLAYAAGHILGTHQPGQRGTVGIAAHRDTFFRPLRGIRLGDLVQVDTPGGRFEYRVESTAVVGPEDTRLLRSAADTLVLVTCFPFNFVGAAPRRFVVRCVPLQSDDLASDEPDVV